MNEQQREQLQADALDAYLTDLQVGRQAARPSAVPADQAAFLSALVDFTEASSPKAGFVSQLGARLRALARPTRPRPWNALWETRRMVSMNRRLVFSLAGAAALVLVVIAALALIVQNRPAVGPGQVAQLPTATSTATSMPTAVPSHTTLPPTATRTTVPPTVAPTSTPTPGDPIALPALVRWYEGGFGGGGMGVPLSPGWTYVLGTALPAGPAQLAVYLQREPEALSAAYAAETAAQLGAPGQVYQSIRLAVSLHPEEEPVGSYLVVDGARQVLFDYVGNVHYTDRNRTSFYEGRWNVPEGVPSLEAAVSAAESFLRPTGLLEEAYQIAASGENLLFHRLIEGQWLLVEPVARTSIWVDGQVGQAQIWPLALDPLAEYPILSAQEAWELLRSDEPGGRVWRYPYRSAEMAPWGEWSEVVRANNPRFWDRSYRAGQQAHRFGTPVAWFPVEVGGLPYLAMGDLVLVGDVQALADYILQQYAREEWIYVHVWGEVEDAGERQALRVAGWEPAQEAYWGGTIRRQGAQDVLVTDDGRTIPVPDLPADLPDGTRVFVSGDEANGLLEWHVIQASLVAQDPPPVPEGISEVQMTVEQIDLVYLALAPNVVPPERFSDLGYRAVQPVWRFRGHSDQGVAFEVYVQAIQGAYVD